MIVDMQLAYSQSSIGGSYDDEDKEFDTETIS